MSELAPTFQPAQDKTLRRPPQAYSRGVLGWVAGKYNRARRAVASPQIAPTNWAELREIREFAVTPSDINEHLERIFIEGVLCRPKLIVELGVRGGASTFVFERVARLCNASLISVDLDDCSSTAAYENWAFVQADDVEFAASLPSFCKARNLPVAIDLLFVDTSHYYEHTVNEINAWFPLLAPRAKVIFHDTNLKVFGPRNDGCIEMSWDNDRGVIRAIESYLGITLPEQHEFVKEVSGWIIRHWPRCNGLTILDRI